MGEGQFLNINFFTALFTLLNTILLFWVLKKFLFKPIMELIKERQQEIDDMYADADKAKEEAQLLQQQYESKLAAAADEAERTVKDAVELGNSRREEIIRQANEEAEAIREKAEDDIERQRKKAMNEAKDEISVIALAIAGKVVGRELDEKDQSQLVDQFIEQLGDGVLTQIANQYGQALYSLAKDETSSQEILEQLTVLDQAFLQEPEFVRLLRAPQLPKQERCQILDDSFKNKIHPYVLNFMKLLTEKGYMAHFHDCCKAFRAQYNLDHDILPVQAVTAVPMSGEQIQKLTEKLNAMTGKTVELTCKTDPAVLGGVRLDYDGKQVDGTVQSRLDAVAKLLKNTQL